MTDKIPCNSQWIRMNEWIIFALNESKNSVMYKHILVYGTHTMAGWKNT